MLRYEDDGSDEGGQWPDNPGPEDVGSGDSGNDTEGSDEQ